MSTLPLFKSSVFILPGLGNSGDDHWQTHWEKQFHFTRINQKDWETPVRADWIETIDNQLCDLESSDIILVGHSLACAAIAFWSGVSNKKIKGALLVAPSDTEAPSYPTGTRGFKPMPLKKLPFPSIVITSNNDFYVSVARAQQFARAWGSELINIGNAGHINVASGHGPWPEGLVYLRQLDQ